MTPPDINAVMDAHAEEIMAIEGVTGVAVGALDDGTPSILILILKESEDLRRRLPDSIGGHPVRTMVTGKFSPMGGEESEPTR
jgi:hypothetical protein